MPATLLILATAGLLAQGPITCCRELADVRNDAENAETIITEHPEIKTWYVAGHSMGGLTASGFAADHLDEVDGLILIAAYTNRDLTETAIPVLSIYGDADGVLNKELYDKRLSWYPENFEEHIIPGANHAQYGDYGEQPRDNDATISAEEQRAQTAAIMLDWLGRLNA